MKNTVINLKNLDSLPAVETSGFCVGIIVQITNEGRAMVDFPGNPSVPIEARSVVSESTISLNDDLKGIQVLLVFEDGDPKLPIIMGIINDKLCPIRVSDEVTLPIERPRDSLVDGERIILEAKKEIVLRCGKSSVILRKDGKVVVKGIQITSRASGTHKIKGSSVNIN